MRTVAIVQARMGSTRLPGKVLLPLNGHTVIGEVLTRCKRIPGVDDVVCAIPDSAENDKLCPPVYWYGGVYRGPEHDVLARYYGAAKEYLADVIIRITGDCPLLSPGVCGFVLDAFKLKGADYASNVHPRTFPQGYDCEVFTMGALERAHREAGADAREHVTTWMAQADNIKRININSPWRMDGRLTLDTEDDYKVICAAFGHRPYEHLSAPGSAETALQPAG